MRWLFQYHAYTQCCTREKLVTLPLHVLPSSLFQLSSLLSFFLPLAPPSLPLLPPSLPLLPPSHSSLPPSPSLPLLQVGCVSDLLKAIKTLLIRCSLWDMVSTVDNLRLSTTIRMLNIPHFNAKMNALKEVTLISL